MNALATAVVLLALAALIAHGVSLVVGPGRADRRRELEELGVVPFVTLWGFSALLLIVVRSLHGDAGLAHLLTTTGVWTSALGVAFALAGGAFAATRWLLGRGPDRPSWNMPVASISGGAGAALVGMSTLPL